MNRCSYKYFDWIIFCQLFSDWLLELKCVDGVCVCVWTDGRSFRAVLTSNNTTAFVLVSVHFYYRTSHNQCVVVFMYGTHIYQNVNTNY